LYNAAGGLESSAEVDDDYAAVGIVLLVFFALGLWCGTIGVDRQLDPGSVTLDTPTFRFFSSPDLVDDEGRKHGSGLAFAMGDRGLRELGP
jgi:hypothetical protein